MFLFLPTFISLLSLIVTVTTQSLSPPISIDDTSRLISYGDGADWLTLIDQDPDLGLHNNTDTASHVQGALLRFTFEGVAIEYWGSRGPTRGLCRVTIDGVEAAIVPTFLDAYLAPISPLVNITGLDDGMHTIEISVVEDVAPNECEIDRFVYYQSIPSSAPSHSSHTARNVGIAVGVTAGVLLLLLIGWVALKRRSRARKAKLARFAILKTPGLVQEEGWKPGHSNKMSYEHGHSVDVPKAARKDIWRSS